MTRWWGGGSALLLAALLPAACTEKIVLEHPVGGSGGGGFVNDFDAGPVGGGNGTIDGGGGNSDANRLHCSGSASATPLNAPLQKPAIMFALDRSQSMTRALGNNGTRFSVTAKAIADAVNAYSALVSFGYVEFPTGDSSCSGMCCAAGFSPAPLGSSSSAISMWLNQCVSNQSLTCNTNSDTVPTGQALNKIANAFRHNTTNALYALLLTDGPPTPNCQLDPTQTSEDACDQAATLIGDMSNGSVSTFPITTFIVGIGDVAVDTGTTPPVNNCLNKMAFLGGNPAALTSPYYALASTDTSVHAQVDGIVTNSICQVDIEDGLFDPSRQIEVDFKNMPMIPPDPINGWTLNKTRLTFNGWSCTMLLIPGLKSTSNPSRYITVKQCVDPAHPFQPPPP